MTCLNRCKKSTGSVFPSNIFIFGAVNFSGLGSFKIASENVDFDMFLASLKASLRSTSFPLQSRAAAAATAATAAPLSATAAAVPSSLSASYLKSG
ncbi:hypothetical protein TIFTF001_027783 [Ficus carica]|uniref:Uncharacterized protein n=1 Tax=Ficus carica TaxID=3494 RepID=A0AA88J0M4_FICCA|nr:hypothetical protein TIFTF001_027783 [Ficus carica]